MKPVILPSSLGSAGIPNIDRDGLAFGDAATQRGGVVVAAGGVQPIAEYFGFVTVEYTTPDGENVTVDGILDGNERLNEQGEVILKLLPAGEVGSFVNEDGEVIEADGEFEIAD